MQHRMVVKDLVRTAQPARRCLSKAGLPQWLSPVISEAGGGLRERAMHMDVLVPRSTGMCESGLAREYGVDICISFAGCRVAFALLKHQSTCHPGVTQEA